ncbi:MAG TPA: hypothetical protein VF669_02875 [Tepidisphaeraceae bacterium]|jgi:hypothetical protein
MKPILLILLSLPAVALGQTSADTALAPPIPQTQPAVQNPAEFEPFGVRVSVPTDWRRLTEIQPTQVGRWGVFKPGSTTEIATVLVVDMEAARGRTTETAGQELAKKMKGKVDLDAELAGAKACRVTGEVTTAKGVRPVEALVARHEEYIYILTSTGTEGGIAHSQALQDLRQGFDFVPVTAPTEHLDLRPEPFAVFNRFSIKTLQSLRPSPEQRQNVLQWRVFNFRRSRPDIVMTMELLNVSPGATLEAVGTQLAVTSGAKKDDVQWKALNGTPRRIVSNTFKVKGRSLPVRIGLVQLSDRELAMINFGMSTPDETDRVLYEARCNQMLESVEMLKNQK